MVDQNQIESLIEVLELFKVLDLTKHVVLIGSWRNIFIMSFSLVNIIQSLHQ